MTSVKRHFLGWNQPFLPHAVEWLQHHRHSDTLGSADQMLIIVPGQSVVWKLQSQMVEVAARLDRAIDLPRIETTSRCIDRLINSNVRLADQTTVMIATAMVLRSLPKETIESIVGTRYPSDQDTSAWFALARQVIDATELLSFGGLAPVVDSWDEDAQKILTTEAKNRFELLQIIQTNVQACLHRDGLELADLKRVALLEHDGVLDVEHIRQVVLVGTSDLPRIAIKLIDHLSSIGVSIDSLIRAPENQGEAFDMYGCVDVDYWLHVPIEIPDDCIRVAGSPSGQAASVIRELSKMAETCSPNQITIASTDVETVPIIRSYLSGFGVRSRFAGGTSAIQSPAVLVLNSLSDLLRTSSFASYAAFVRHPDVYRRLHIQESTLHKLDRYSMNYVPLKVQPNNWFVPSGSHTRAQELVDLHAQVFELVDQCTEINYGGARITECSNVVRDFLLKLYGEETYDRTDKKLISLNFIFGVLDRLDACSSSLNESFGTLQLCDGIDFILSELEACSIPEYPDPNAIEIVGWLESMVADTANLIVVGMSADLIGGSIKGDLFLPDRLRKALGLETIDHRLARDAHAMTAMQKLRVNDGRLVWIVGRKNAGGDPLTPNPLLLRCKDAVTLAQRARQLVVSFDREVPELPIQLTPTALGKGMRIPIPDEIEYEPLKKLSVTAFKDYIACPYRFWLSRVLMLRVEVDGETELDPKLFGSLVHSVLEQFGSDELIRLSTNEHEIEAFLSDRMEAIIQNQFGPNVSGAIGIQVDQARHRLRSFAEHQVRSTQSGWRILCTELKVRKILDVNGEPFTISGVIDRIDVHTDGRIRVLDYKTGSLGANAAHFKKRDGQWIDLQLPLYRELLTEIPELEGMDLSDANVELGYFKIGDQEQAVGVDLLDVGKEAMAAVDDVIESIITSIQNNEYGAAPTDPAPKYSDDYSWICQDNNIIEESVGSA